jgi:enterochelin esterase family protein
MRHIATVLWAATALPPILAAQDPPRIVSPEVREDRAVVFRLWAPHAADVQLTGDWMGPKPPVALSKGADGVWTATVGPLEPKIYSYGFLVDGIRTSDPSCRCVFTWANRSAQSRLVIPAATASPWEPRDRPPGTLHHERFFSERQQLMRRFVVYTPPGYESGTGPYPALVLLPGTLGDENDWTSGGGFAEVMFDNLIADGRMEPTVVIMHASDVLDLPDMRRGDQNLGAFEKVLTDELLPLVRRRYRLSADPRSWAIAGLSLGGEFGMYVGLKHPELFRTVASLSGSLVATSFDQRFGPLIAHPEALRRDYRLIWLGCGSQDVFLDGAKAFAGRLGDAKIPHVFRQFPGPHALPVAREQLAELLPLLFRP